MHKIPEEHLMPGDTVILCSMHDGTSRRGVVATASLCNTEPGVCYTVITTRGATDMLTEVPVHPETCKIELIRRCEAAASIYDGNSGSLPRRLGYKVRIPPLVPGVMATSFIQQMQAAWWQGRGRKLPTYGELERVLRVYTLVGTGDTKLAPIAYEHVETIPSFYVARKSTSVVAATPQGEAL